VQVLVLFSRFYEFTNEQKQLVQGGEIHYVDPAAPTPVDGEKGFPPLRLTCKYDLQPSFTQVPGVYELQTVQRRGRNNSVTLALVGAELVAPYVFSRSQQVSEVPDRP